MQSEKCHLANKWVQLTFIQKQIRKIILSGNISQKLYILFLLFLYLYTTYCCFQGVPGPMVIELYNLQKFFTHVSSMSKCVTNSTISSNIVYYVSRLKRPPSHRPCKWSVLQVFMWHFQRKKLVQGFTSSEMKKCK